MTKIDRLLIGALVLGVWALVAMQFFGGMTASAAQSTHVYGEVAGTNGPYETDVTGGPTLWVCCRTAISLPI